MVALGADGSARQARRSLVLEQRHDSGRSRARADEAEREAGDREPSCRQLIEVGQALDLAILEVDLVRGPENSSLAAFDRLGRLEMKRAVPAPGIDPHHPDAALVEPAGGLRA